MFSPRTRTRAALPIHIPKQTKSPDVGGDRYHVSRTPSFDGSETSLVSAPSRPVSPELEPELAVDENEARRRQYREEEEEEYHQASSSLPSGTHVQWHPSTSNSDISQNQNHPLLRKPKRISLPITRDAPPAEHTKARAASTSPTPGFHLPTYHNHNQLQQQSDDTATNATATTGTTVGTVGTLGSVGTSSSTAVSTSIPNPTTSAPAPNPSTSTTNLNVTFQPSTITTSKPASNALMKHPHHNRSRSSTNIPTTTAPSPLRNTVPLTPVRKASASTPALATTATVTPAGTVNGTGSLKIGGKKSHSAHGHGASSSSVTLPATSTSNQNQTKANTQANAASSASQLLLLGQGAGLDSARSLTQNTFRRSGTPLSPLPPGIKLNPVNYTSIFRKGATGGKRRRLFSFEGLFGSGSGIPFLSGKGKGKEKDRAGNGHRHGSAGECLISGTFTINPFLYIPPELLPPLDSDPDYYGYGYEGYGEEDGQYLESDVDSDLDSEDELGAYVYDYGDYFYDANDGGVGSVSGVALGQELGQQRQGQGQGQGGSSNHDHYHPSRISFQATCIMPTVTFASPPANLTPCLFMQENVWNSSRLMLFLRSFYSGQQHTHFSVQSQQQYLQNAQRLITVLRSDAQHDCRL